MDQPAFNPAARRLCPDGACVGIIGADGRCKECGRAGDGKAVAAVPAAAAPPEMAGDEETEATGQATSATIEAGADTAGSDGYPHDANTGFNPARRLCDDGSCVGVVGSDGVCAACGRRAE
jgi:hypothetical protein